MPATRPPRRPGSRSRRRGPAIRRCPRTSQERLGGRPSEVDLGDLDRGVGDFAVAGERDAADDLVRAAGQAREVVARLGRVARLAEDVAVDGDERVGAERQRRWHRGGLAARVLLGDGDRVAVALLLHVRGADVEGDADLLEDRAPLWRRAREGQRSIREIGGSLARSTVVAAGARQARAYWWYVCACRGPAAAGGARQNPSRSRMGALFREEQRGLAMAGLRRVRAVDHVLADLDREVTADRAGWSPRAGWWRRSPGGRRGSRPWPSSTSATIGPLVMNSTSSPKNGLPSCSA